MVFSKKIWVLIVLMFLVGAGVYGLQTIKRGSQAYLYGYPLVLMDLSRQAMDNGQAPNQLIHNQTFPDHNFRNGGRPNIDTLYSIAWINLAEGPLVLSVPDTQGRYYVMPLMDAWTNIFASVGKRTTGTKAGSYFITGPNWKGDVPTNTVVISSPTNMVLMIGRVQTNGLSDIPNVAKLQRQFKLTSLSDWNNGIASPFMELPDQIEKPSTDPYESMQNMQADEFFGRLSALMAAQPSPDADAAALENLEGLGLLPSQGFTSDNMGFVDRQLLNIAIKVTRDGIEDFFANGRVLENGWAVIRDTIGNYGTHYKVRTGVAMIGLGALEPAEASYPSANIDSNGEALNGANTYRLHFPAGKLPPVDAFWSLTLYNEDDFLVENALSRFALGDRDPLTFNTDGSLDLTFSHKEPATALSNWLPAPDAPFALTMRLYLPKEDFLNGTWKLPVVERLD